MYEFKSVNNVKVRLSQTEINILEAADIVTAAADVVRKEEEILTKIKELLRDSGWTRLDDAAPADKTKYDQYRQGLRAIPAQPGFPDNIVWPTDP